jgi:hypothetical protein
MILLKQNVYKSIVISFIIICMFPVKTVVSAEVDPLCGPESLLFVCQQFGIKATMQEICDLSEYDKENGTSIFGLYKAAMTKGLQVLPMEIGLDDLCHVDGYSIVFVDGNHFVVVSGCEKESVLIYDLPAKQTRQSKKQFSERWSGEALVFPRSSETFLSYLNSKPPADETPIPSNINEGPPSISFDNVSRDFGTVIEDTLLTHTFYLTNRGSENLEILSIRPSCGCTAATTSANTVLPGKKSDIIVEFDTAGFLGDKENTVMVRTNDPENSLVVLTINATIVSPVKVLPERIWLGDINSGGKILREIKVVDPGDESLQVTNISSPPDISGEISEAIQDTTFKKVIPVMLSMNITGKAGPFERIVEIHTNNKDRSMIAVSVSGVILPSVSVFPTQIFFGEVKSNSTKTSQITISKTKNNIVGIDKIITGYNFITTHVETLENNNKINLQVTFHAPKKKQTVDNHIEVVVLFENKETAVVEIPLYAKVTGN